MYQQSDNSIFYVKFCQPSFGLPHPHSWHQFQLNSANPPSDSPTLTPGINSITPTYTSAHRMLPPSPQPQPPTPSPLLPPPPTSAMGTLS
ncbi:unnamed protein product [Schistocephalus solidus]|uniref:Ovule protein n=1 Tax=Schistocephalus solidus TaxID=70667 RepID=A0A183SPD9_SCHSO|nr:unnamed protein product [Schistocephalus solidus]